MILVHIRVEQMVLFQVEGSVRSVVLEHFLPLVEQLLVQIVIIIHIIDAQN